MSGLVNVEELLRFLIVPEGVTRLLLENQLLFFFSCSNWFSVTNVWFNLQEQGICYLLSGFIR